MNLTKDEVLKLAKEYKLVEYLNLECTEKSISWIFEEDELLAFSNAIADLQRKKVLRPFQEKINDAYFEELRWFELDDLEKIINSILENKERI